MIPRRKRFRFWFSCIQCGALRRPGAYRLCRHCWLVLAAESNGEGR